VTKARLLRIQQEQKADANYSLEDRLDFAAAVQSALVYRLLGTGKTIPVDWVDSWFLDEKIPADFKKHSASYDFPQLLSDHGKVKNCESILTKNENDKCTDE
jgi:hypothetical protein